MPNRVDVQVANIAAAAEVLHSIVTAEPAFVLEPDQLRELARAQLQLSEVLFIEMGEPSEDREGREEGPTEDPSSLTPEQEVARIEGEKRDEMNELPDP